MILKKLEYLEELLNTTAFFDEDGFLIVTEPMNELIKISKEQLKNGEFKTNQQVMDDARSWLNERKFFIQHNDNLINKVRNV
jgi:hypothetical protein